MSDTAELTQAINEAGKEVRESLTTLLSELQGKGGAAGEPRLFFPNGIELIDVEVTVVLKEPSFAFKAIVAGEKGVKKLFSSARSRLSEENGHA